jgi:hypothetical protein
VKGLFTPTIVKNDKTVARPRDRDDEYCVERTFVIAFPLHERGLDGVC